MALAISALGLSSEQRIFLRLQELHPSGRRPRGRAPRAGLAFAERASPMDVVTFAGSGGGLMVVSAVVPAGSRESS